MQLVYACPCPSEPKALERKHSVMVKAEWIRSASSASRGYQQKEQLMYDKKAPKPLEANESIHAIKR